MFSISSFCIQQIILNSKVSFAKGVETRKGSKRPKEQPTERWGAQGWDERESFQCFWSFHSCPSFDPSFMIQSHDFFKTLGFSHISKRKIMILITFSFFWIIMAIFSWSQIGTYNSCRVGCGVAGGLKIFEKFQKNFWNTYGSSLLFLSTSDTPCFWS